MAAAQILASMGLDGVNLGGGMHAWAAEGLAIVTPNGAPGAII
jgi:rhodanese-related sulfurtransferase